ncbi:MAG TPA: 4Fe-4S dicluster domain-containing protein [Chloroflexota bacterium]|nr:4Fe-4S dicluster domain-containing protein [Chloroflexota bacterium]
MNILNVIVANLRQGPVTLRFPARVAPPSHYRGPVQIDTARCLACGVCAYVCPSAAITVTDRTDSCDWSYDPGRCTFCGRCADLCMGKALSMKEEPAPVYTTPGALAETHQVHYPLCPQCGRPALPISDELLAKALSELTDEARSRSRLCDRCRKRHTQRTLKETTRWTSR